MESNNPDFIIKTYKDDKTNNPKEVLRRYKGHDSVVVIPDGVEKISDYTFADDIEPNDSITKIVIPNSVTEISSCAFSYCMSLKEINFPQNMEEFFIDFTHCPSLEEITLPESVKNVRNLHYTKTLKKINIGENITHVYLTIFQKHGEAKATIPKSIAKVLLTNPAYTKSGDFIINKKHRITLFRISFDNTEVRIPDGIETLGPNTFYELYQYSRLEPEMKCVEKIVIPASVRKINESAFFSCNSLKEVIYEGNSSGLEVNPWAFLMCVNFHKDGREIICADTPKQEEKNSKPTNRRLERIALIHKLIKSRAYPNSKELLNICNTNLWGKDEKKYWTLVTISRDLAFLRDWLDAPLKYDFFHKGYFYEDNDFTPDLSRIRF